MRGRPVSMKLAAVVLPVADVDRSKAFYRLVGFREDVDFATGDGFRVVRCTPPGSACSIVFGRGISAAAPGSVQGLLLVVRDLDAVRAGFIGRGVDVGPVVHD